MAGDGFDELDVLYERVAGLDVGKAEVVVCLRVPVAGPGRGRRRYSRTTRTFSTMTGGLQECGDWLAGEGVDLVVMEATGDYWKPVYYALEGRFSEVWLVNARDVKNVKGRKTDVSDAQWLARLAAYGLVRPSLVPPPPIRRLRDLTRQRMSLVRDRTRAINRLEKVLEDAGIKTSLVLSKTLGASGRAMIEALIDGERDPLVLADLALGRARAKIDDLREALIGRFDDHHAFLARQALVQIDALDRQIAAFTDRIDTELRPFATAVRRLQTIPGVGRRIAEVIIAETGGEMSRFPTAEHLANWAGVAPGNNRSAGRNMGSTTTHGNGWLLGALGDAAAATIRRRNSYYGAYYRRLARRRGHRRALMAVMHKIMIAVWHMLTNNVDYHDLGADYHQPRPEHLERRKRRLIAELTALGVDINPRTDAA